MSDEPDVPPGEGMVQGGWPPRWIVFEMTDEGGLAVRTLYGRKDVKDPAQAGEILKTLVALMDEID
jgi:hypothetical protein